MNDFLDLSLAEARARLAARDISSTELTKAYLSRIEATANLNAYITITHDQAMLGAAQADARLAKGKGGILEGICIAVKDLFCTNGVQTTAASRMLDGFIPTYESTVTSNLWNAGAVLLGKTNLDEFAMGSSNTTSYYGAVESPWRSTDASDKKRVPGGSSGGSAAAVAARSAIAATGTDTGGSIRQPASFSGIVGIKPTYGRCSRWGIIAFASSLDQAGPMARTVEDAAILLQAMASYDPKDSTSAKTTMPNLLVDINKSVKGMSIGVPIEYRIDSLPEETSKIWDHGIDYLKSEGADIVHISLPHTKYALPTYYIIAPAEASSNLARYDGVRYGLRINEQNITDMYTHTRTEGFGEEVKRRILLGTYVLSSGYYDAYYLKAQKMRNLLRHDFNQAFDKVDAILTPTTLSDAFEIGDNKDDPLKMYLQDVFTVPASLVGLPSISVPVTLSKRGLPIGLQVLGRMFDENSVVRVGRTLERTAEFKAMTTLVNGILKDE
ncbi:glutamyl-tRNA(Gln) and/or aspartyl-tRNA(Asn) amidotransferase, A subunit [Candidatus Endolissoclinum faulkneri L2]|uniref:Glutamyl-tRNA(Gln) amidotransferase subunit A n=1 Tax=Candidatus Endolissoclinum faulkneri L2 TaxID=1193729 RepID=K7ZCH2_9PROT|nr:Asp-tRNA(Asn)/Glu-tRNA(Gln) amidotransferase subunit GatA [Candidatus Endolissoclinum faulkneri]AFX98576.1 glutamyl-tRNA(Gln) and/or aspartyl-tRNA(Asn) amidotransferase, A subunit [Candidatus Endolissoclinum faulkneri L2]